jgi:hypothetical protein
MFMIHEFMIYDIMYDYDMKDGLTDDLEFEVVDLEVAGVASPLDRL